MINAIYRISSLNLSAYSDISRESFSYVLNLKVKKKQGEKEALYGQPTTGSCFSRNTKNGYLLFYTKQYFDRVIYNRYNLLGQICQIIPAYKSALSITIQPVPGFIVYIYNAGIVPDFVSISQLSNNISISRRRGAYI